jgi:hydroxymethylglutaryl-CoA synthase
MGSSAATIISTQWALNAFYQKNLSKDALLSLAIESENLQHGRSSGIDLYLSTYGGCWLIDGIQKTPLSLEKLPLFWIHTGAPESTTGECVAHSQSCFQQDATLSAQFRAVTESMASAIETQDAPQFQTALQHNHELLCHLGVVPARIQAFLSQVHQAGAAGKICGAGSIRGESGGIVMVCGDRPLLEPLCHAQGWTLQPLIPTMQGVRILEK